MDGGMRYVMGELVSNTTIIKDGVDLKKRFHDVRDHHPLTYHWADGVKDMIALKFYDEVMKDS